MNSETLAALCEGELEALLRRDWAVRVICAANADGFHFSFPYPHRLGGFEMIQSQRRDRDLRHHGDTITACFVNAAESVWPDLPESIRAELGPKP